MQTKEKIDTQIQASSQKRRRPFALLITVGLLTAIILFIVYNVTTLANQHIHQMGTTTVVKQTPKATWSGVLDGYSVTAIVAAPSNPATLYACAIPVQTATGAPYKPGVGIPALNYTLLQSTDGGTNWHAATHLDGGCQIALDPTNSNDLYTVASASHRASNGQVPDVLKHSTDGGRSWTDIAPTLLSNGTQIATAWHVQQITMVGNQLFGIQQLPAQGIQPLRRSQSPSVVTRLGITRLVASSDGGHTWTIIDNNLDKSGQGTRDYIVSPYNAQIIYELVGTQWPGYLRPSTPQNATIYGGNLTLYKTGDGGKTWTALLENLPFNSKLQVAGANADTIYVGSTIGVTQLKGYDSGQDSVVQPAFSVQVSSDGGGTWRAIKAPTNASFVQNWFVSADGQLYASTGSAPHIQPIATTGTTTVPSATAQIGPGGYKVSSVQGTGSVTAIQRYSSTTHTWTVVTQTIPNSALLTITKNTTSHGVSLWLLSSNDNKIILYRYVVM